ncbi:MAG TPA: tetraacyldisaccharide 4'-kinase [Bryobacteraceae bacterium]|nr:tetraacyldisaccharide 4'-kinase [Bryobacteraceae bacterium]
MKIKGIYLLYRVLQAFGLPVLLLYFVIRGLRNRTYWRSIPQRFGFLPRSFKQTGPGAIWLHAVSVGEVLSCVQFVRSLRREFPLTPLFVSTSTLTGYGIASQKLGELTEGVFYAPVDYVFAVRRVLRVLRPSLVVIAETEIWPNLFREARRTGAALAIVNGRISDRAFPRYAKMRRFFAVVLPAADCICAQSEAIRQRFLALGAPAARTHVAGNFKYDFEAREAAPDSPVRAFLSRISPSAVWIAASTMAPAGAGDPDEDDAVIAAFREVSKRHSHLLLLLAPRKPERFDAAAEKLKAARIPYVRRSSLNDGATLALPGVLLLDSIGELSGLFSLASVVFMGGTLASRGGHNILEPALFAKPVIIGPHMENFQAIADAFHGAGAAIQIRGADELSPAVEGVLADPERARDVGRRALECAEARRGATARTVEMLRALYCTHVPSYRPSMPWFAIAWALSRVWRWGSRRKQARDVANQKRLDVPVISIGNITMGGTGKTPCVLLLAETLKSRGRAPGILTRGYGRHSPVKHLVAPPGASVHATDTGDEPQQFVRAGIAPVGIGPNRFITGVRLAHEFHTDVLLLDDGFQHRKLARDLDIVLVDCLNPFGGGYEFPLGRLREPIEGLGRADIIVITRSQFSGLRCAVEEAVRRINTHAPIFRGRVLPQAWVEYQTGRTYALDDQPFNRVGAFCGIGNPQSFRRTLASLGIDVTDCVEFADHQKYQPYHLQRLVHEFHFRGATAMVTTEKDAINLGKSADHLPIPMPIYWLKVWMEIDPWTEFLECIDRRIGAVRHAE